MASLLVDTDIFIDHLRGATEFVAGSHRLHYSVLTRADLVAATALAHGLSLSTRNRRDFASVRGLRLRTLC